MIKETCREETAGADGDGDTERGTGREKSEPVQLNSMALFPSLRESVESRERLTRLDRRAGPRQLRNSDEFDTAKIVSTSDLSRSARCCTPHRL